MKNEVSLYNLAAMIRVALIKKIRFCSTNGVVITYPSYVYIQLFDLKLIGKEVIKIKKTSRYVVILTLQVGLIR